MTSPLDTAALPLAAHKSSSRLHWLDLLRVVAMMDIVSMHVTDVHLLKGVGLPILLLTAAAFGTIRSRKLAPRQVLGRRARRLLVPWLSWCVVYTIAFVILARRHGEQPFGWVEPLMVLYGPAVHLWFVTFAFLAALVIAVLVKALHIVSTRRAVPIATGIGVVALLATSIVRLHLDVPTPFPQWIFSLGAIPLGIALGLSIGEPKRSRRARLLVALACAGVGLAIVGMNCFPLMPWTHEKWLIRRFGYALAALAVAAIWPGRCLPGAYPAVHATFGVYLAHPLVRLVLLETSLMPATPWIQIVTVYAICLVLAAGLLRTRLRWLV
jgi:surface polysaccharide O-acyltransferase-like enzyme